MVARTCHVHRCVCARARARACLCPHRRPSPPSLCDCPPNPSTLTADAATSPQRAPLPPGFSDTYTLSGCKTPEYCGVFRRVAAHCTRTDIGALCPGSAGTRPSYTDPTTCDGVPVYQREGAAGGAVLYRFWSSGGYYEWQVGSSDALRDCTVGYYYRSRPYPTEDRNPPPADSAPDAAVYEWSDPRGYDSSDGAGFIHIVAGDGH